MVSQQPYTHTNINRDTTFRYLYCKLIYYDSKIGGHVSIYSDNKATPYASSMRYKIVEYTTMLKVTAYVSKTCVRISHGQKITGIFS